MCLHSSCAESYIYTYIYIYICLHSSCAESCVCTVLESRQRETGGSEGGGGGRREIQRGREMRECCVAKRLRKRGREGGREEGRGRGDGSARKRERGREGRGGEVSWEQWKKKKERASESKER